MEPLPACSPDSQTATWRNCGMEGKVFWGYKVLYHGILPWSLLPAQPGGSSGRICAEPPVQGTFSKWWWLLWPVFLPVLIFHASQFSWPTPTSADCQWVWALVTGPPIPLDHQQVMLHQYPQCTVFPAYPELPSAWCGASNEIIAHVVMDADILYFHLFPHVNIRHWLDHHAWREVKGFMWVRVDQYLNQSPLVCLWESCLHWWLGRRQMPPGHQEIHLPQTSS